MADEKRPETGSPAEPTGDELGAAMAAAFGPAGTTGYGLTERPGTVVGRYKLLQQIGEGGFGVVCMAEQTEPIRRRVALKIVKAGMDTAAVVARFDAERQALALMDHPNIAHVLDAGATETGRPFFVMELVRGMLITEYCDRHRLDTRQRLELFATVCNAVQHAHQKGIIHRDIKPSNVMVALHDGQPVPKVIDFGVAKATQVRLTEKTLFTQYGQFIGTPVYMSPEQAEMSPGAPGDVDTRSDIYSLGVLLYELLTGTTPIDQQRLRNASYAEMQRIIREVEPPTPSTRMRASGEGLASICAKRQTEPKRLGRLLRGDLDWIVMKAIEKDRTRRYETANAFAMDVRRYLNDEPVLAGPPSTTYRLRRLASKHRALIGAATALAAILMVATVLSTVQAFRAMRAQARATAERNRAVFRFTELASAVGADNTTYFSDFTTQTFTDATTTGDWERAADQLDKASRLLGDRQPGWWQTHWWIIGPFDSELEEPCAPETSLDPFQRLGESTAGSPAEWIAWIAYESGFLDLTRVMLENGIGRTDFQYSSTYAQGRVYSDQERLVAIHATADDWLRLWLNGRLLSQERTKRLAIPVRLKRGWNTILAKVYNEQGDQNLRFAMSDSWAEIIDAAIAEHKWDQAASILAELEREDRRRFLFLSARLRRKHAEHLIETGSTTEAKALLDQARALYRRLIMAYSDDPSVAHEWRLFTLAHDFNWGPLHPLEMESEAGATLTAQPDGSILVSGINPDRDTYTIVADAELDVARYLRIEALPDASFYEGGSGRCPLSGNFHLSEVEVRTIAPGNEAADAPEQLAQAITEFSNRLQDISNIIDKDPATYWDMWPRQTEPHSVYVAFEEPIRRTRETMLQIRLIFKDPRYSRHTLGRFRLSVSGDQLVLPNNKQDRQR